MIKEVKVMFCLYKKEALIEQDHTVMLKYTKALLKLLQCLIKLKLMWRSLLDVRLLLFDRQGRDF